MHGMPRSRYLRSSHPRTVQDDSRQGLTNCSMAWDEVTVRKNKKNSESAYLVGNLVRAPDPPHINMPFPDSMFFLYRKLHLVG